MKNNIYLFLALCLFSGCGASFQDFMMARVWMFKAENAYAKAYSLKVKRVPYEKRLEHYRVACDYFYHAYERDPGTFTLNRINQGTDSCWRVEDQEKERVFAEFEKAYIKEHPKEFEYGDTDATIPE